MSITTPTKSRRGRANIHVTGYIDPEVDPVSYRNQPVEADAWAYGDRIEAGVYGGGG